MVVLSQSAAFCSGLIRAKLPLRNLENGGRKFYSFTDAKVVSSRRILGGNIGKSTEFGFGSSYVVRSGKDYYQSSSNNDLPQEPFPLPLIREALWAVRSLFVFLVEQPSQLKYIEWPEFAGTFKTAILTLVLVALLIVALSSVDSALSFLLALILRRPA